MLSESMIRTRGLGFLASGFFRPMRAVVSVHDPSSFHCNSEEIQDL
jgi:hypothetical protein